MSCKYNTNITGLNRLLKYWHILAASAQNPSAATAGKTAVLYKVVMMITRITQDSLNKALPILYTSIARSRSKSEFN